jgi:hypothetical protein
MTAPQAKRHVIVGRGSVPAKTSRSAPAPVPTDMYARFVADVSAQPDGARNFLIQNGFLTKTGRLAKRYGG